MPDLLAGRCTEAPGEEAQGRSQANQEDMKHFSVTTDIPAAPGRVWDVMTDVERWHEWTPSIASVTYLGDAKFEVGSRVLIRQPKFPPALWKIATIVPGQSFTWVSVAPGLRIVGNHAVERDGKGSRATLGLDMHGLFSAFFARLTGDITQRYIAMEAKGLKARSQDPAYRHADPG